MSVTSSHLTRAVFRALIANRPYVVPGCCSQAHRSSRAIRSRPIQPLIHRRPLFGALLGSTVGQTFKNAKSTPKNLENALGRLVDVVRARRTNSRPPVNAEIVDAFKFVLSVHLESRKRLTRNDVFLLTEAFKHIQEHESTGGENEEVILSRDDLGLILSTLALPSDRERHRTDTSALANLVFEAIPTTDPENRVTVHASEIPDDLWSVYITVLARTGSALQALRLIEASSSRGGTKSNSRVWVETIEGLIHEGHKAQYQSVVEDIGRRRIHLSNEDFEELVIRFAAGDKIQQAKDIFQLQTNAGFQPSTLELQRLVELCARTEDIIWGQQHVDQLRQAPGHSDVVGTLFIWYAAASSTADQFRRQVRETLEQVSVEDLKIESFNSLFEFGLTKNKVGVRSMALEMIDALDMRPNGKTYALQLKHEIERGDLAAAAAVFEQMTREDVPSDDSDLPILNHFVSTIAFSAQPDYELMMRAVDALLERSADFDAEALAGLCRVFLQRDELEDATSMLRHRADFYPETDRARLNAVFRSFILDRSVSDKRAYNAYELFRHAFPEAAVSQRLPLMQTFFDRNRSDLACRVFGHMRMREDIEARPDGAAYAHCFQGIAQCRDIDGLQHVYNMLKLDLEVEAEARVRNGLMLAYIACQMPYTAMIDHFWKIMDSRQGPSYSTFVIALRACETWVPQGGFEARKIIAIMQAWNLEITKELYDSYVGALAGMSEFENTIELIEEMEKDIGERPDAITIGTFYNAIPWQFRKDEVEKWARQAYPDLWEELVAFGDHVDEEWEIRYFKIDRQIDITDEPLFSVGQYNPQLSRQAVQSLEPPVDR